MIKPLETRSGYSEARSNKLTKALRQLRETTRQDGVILLNISFATDRVGVTVSASSGRLGQVLQRVADKILIDFDDGRYDGAMQDG